MTTLWHWMIKYSWKNVQGVCFSSTPLCICKTCDQMFMPWSFWGFVCRGVLGVCLVCHVFWGKQKGIIFWVINKAVDWSANYILYHECDFYCDPTEVYILIYACSIWINVGVWWCIFEGQHIKSQSTLVPSTETQYFFVTLLNSHY